MGLRLACLVLSGLLAGAAPAMAEANCQGQSIPAATAPLICSKTFYVSGKCTRQDELALWGTDEGNRLQPPWEESAISILGAAIVWLHPVHGFQYAFIGNS
jgi:hypothetical protein